MKFDFLDEKQTNSSSKNSHRFAPATTARFDSSLIKQISPYNCHDMLQCPFAIFIIHLKALSVTCIINILRSQMTDLALSISDTTVGSITY
jgi:hypothetical protein